MVACLRRQGKVGHEVEVEAEFSGSSKRTLAKTAFPVGETFVRCCSAILWHFPKWRELARRRVRWRQRQAGRKSKREGDLPITRRCEKALEFGTYLRIKRQIRHGLALSQLGSGTSAQVMRVGARHKNASRLLERRVKGCTEASTERGAN